MNYKINNRIKTIKLGEPNYPMLLSHIKNPPKELFYRGDISLGTKLSIAMVGTRKATSYGIWAASNIAEKLAMHDIVITSGMALGIDTYAHKGALKAKGKTIAVLGSGIDICTPSSNRDLMEEIADSGLLISEYPAGTPASKYTFPNRNRIISGVSVATIVVEAGLASGSLITAELAGEQGKEVYAVPGNIDSVYSIGTNKLIKEGALPLVVAEDILDDFKIKRNIDAYALDELGKAEKEMLDYISTKSEVTVDYLCKITGKQPSEINGIITILEIKGMVYTFMGKIFIAN